MNDALFEVLLALVQDVADGTGVVRAISPRGETFVYKTGIEIVRRITRAKFRRVHHRRPPRSPKARHWHRTSQGGRGRMSLDSVRQHIREQFELARKLHERPRIASTHVEPEEVSLTARAAPIFRRITTTPTEHRRRHCVSYEIIVPNVAT